MINFGKEFKKMFIDNNKLFTNSEIEKILLEFNLYKLQLNILDDTICCYKVYKNNEIYLSSNNVFIIFPENNICIITTLNIINAMSGLDIILNNYLKKSETNIKCDSVLLNIKYFDTDLKIMRTTSLFLVSKVPLSSIIIDMKLISELNFNNIINREEKRYISLLNFMKVYYL